MKGQFLSIQNITDMSGVNSHTLRAWERRYGALKPSRTDSNRRVYSYDDLERVRLLQDLVEQGIAISKIANNSTDDLRKLLAQQKQSTSKKAEESVQAAVRARLQPGIDVKPELVDRLIEHTKKYELHEVNNLLTYFRLSYGAPDFVMKVASPLFRRVGEMVDEREFTISQEHVLSALLRNQVMQLILALTPLLDERLPKVALTTREGDHHEFGIMLTQALCAYEGFPVVYLGANLPAASLAETVNVLNLKDLVIGSTPLPPEHQRISLRDYIQYVRERATTDVNIWLGGYPGDLKLEELYNMNVRYAASFESFYLEIQQRKKRVLDELLNKAE